jgi:hypothetical protein
MVRDIAIKSNGVVSFTLLNVSRPKRDSLIPKSVKMPLRAITTVTDSLVVIANSPVMIASQPYRPGNIMGRLMMFGTGWRWFGKVFDERFGINGLGQDGRWGLERRWRWSPLEATAPTMA